MTTAMDERIDRATEAIDGVKGLLDGQMPDDSRLFATVILQAVDRETSPDVSAWRTVEQRREREETAQRHVRSLTASELADYCAMRTEMLGGPLGDSIRDLYSIEKTVALNEQARRASENKESAK